MDWTRPFRELVEDHLNKATAMTLGYFLMFCLISYLLSDDKLGFALCMNGAALAFIMLRCVEIVNRLREIDTFRGPRGPRGYAGAAGPMGETGPQGPAGLTIR